MSHAGSYSVFPTNPVSVSGGTGSGASFNSSAEVAAATESSDYTVGDVLTVQGGTLNPAQTAAQLRVTSVFTAAGPSSAAGAVGAVDEAIVVAPGSYAVLPTSPAGVTGGTGTGVTFNLTESVTGVTFATVAKTFTNDSGYTVGEVLTVPGGTLNAGQTATQLTVTSVLTPTGPSSTSGAVGAVNTVVVSHAGTYAIAPSSPAIAHRRHGNRRHLPVDDLGRIRDGDNRKL